MLLFAFTSSAQITLQVNISPIKTYKGNLLISVFNSAEGYPGDEKKAIYKYKIESLNSSKISHKIEGLKPGTYAISILHDENGDMICNTNALGIPTEAIGNSNNPKLLFGPPKFKDAQFQYNGKNMILDINLKYF